MMIRVFFDSVSRAYQNNQREMREKTESDGKIQKERKMIREREIRPRERSKNLEVRKDNY